MKKAKFNTRLAIAGALFSGILMMVAVLGYTTETVVENNNNIEAIQLADNSIGDVIIFDGKCGGDEKAKEGEKEKKEGKCGDDKAKAKEGDKEKKEGKCGGDEKAKEGDKEKKEGKCGEGKCGEGKCGGDEKAKEGDKKESKCGEGKCGK